MTGRFISNESIGRAIALDCRLLNGCRHPVQNVATISRYGALNRLSPATIFEPINASVVRISIGILSDIRLTILGHSWKAMTSLGNDGSSSRTGSQNLLARIERATSSRQIFLLVSNAYRGCLVALERPQCGFRNGALIRQSKSAPICVVPNTVESMGLRSLAWPQTR